jgi:hypothetical protein
MKILNIIIFIFTTFLMPSLAQGGNATKTLTDNTEDSNKNRGPNFTQLDVQGVSKDELTAFALAWRKSESNR